MARGQRVWRRTLAANRDGGERLGQRRTQRGLLPLGELRAHAGGGACRLEQLALAPRQLEGVGGAGLEREEAVVEKEVIGGEVVPVWRQGGAVGRGG